MIIPFGSSSNLKSQLKADRFGIMYNPQFVLWSNQMKYGTFSSWVIECTISFNFLLSSKGIVSLYTHNQDLFRDKKSSVSTMLNSWLVVTQFLEFVLEYLNILVGNWLCQIIFSFSARMFRVHLFHLLSFVTFCVYALDWISKMAIIDI